MAKTPAQYPKGEQRYLEDLLVRCGDIFDTSLGVEVQTDKAICKLVPCTGCKRPLAVNTFYAPAIAKCRQCGGSSARSGIGEAEIVQVGRTDPAKAKNLADCLINPSFATATCPLGGEDHRMELKSVNWAERYGPSEMVIGKTGRPEYRQIAAGETVMHQCLDCKTCVTYTTTAQSQYRRMNEPGTGKRINGERWLGVREESDGVPSDD